MTLKKTDISERWFEARIVRGLTGIPQPEYGHVVDDSAFVADDCGYVQGRAQDFNRNREDGICPAAGRKVGKCQSDDLEIPDPKGCEVP